MAKLDKETISEQVLKSRQKLVEAIGDRLGSIEIPASLNLASAQKTASLALTFKDGHGTKFEPGKVIGLTWDSDHKDVAKVDEDGVVTWVKVGTANITVTFGDKVGTCVVNCTS